MAMQTAQRRALRALVQATGNALKTRPLASHAREISIMHSLRRNFGIQEVRTSALDQQMTLSHCGHVLNFSHLGAH